MGGEQHHDAVESVLEKPFLEESALLHSSQAIRPTEGDGRAVGAQGRGHAENRRMDLTEAGFVFGLLRPHGSQG